MKIKMNENTRPVYEEDAPPPPPGTLGRVLYDHDKEIDEIAQRDLMQAKMRVRELVDQEIGLDRLDRKQRVMLNGLMNDKNYSRFINHCWNIRLEIQNLGVIH